LKKIATLCLLYALGVGYLLYTNPKTTAPQARLVANEEEKFDGPAEFAKFHRDIRTGEGQTEPAYKSGYKVAELLKAKQQAKRVHARTKSNGVSAWTERGPSNVPGRTRGLIVDPDDPNKNTWFAGSVGGGVWKTTNAGQAWTNLTPDLLNLSTSVLAMAESNHNVIYLGTGEGFFNLDAIDGTGIFKSTDRGNTWSLLSSTISFPDVNRIAVDPTNENVLCAATNGGIYRSTDGGTTWNEVLNEDLIQDLKATPGDFDVLYATQNSVGVWKSVDAGLSWNLANANMGPLGRVEIAVSPVNTNRIFASAEVEWFGDGSVLLVSSDAAQTWSFVDVKIGGNDVDFLNGQGWYDNTIECDPFKDDVVYFGGVDLFQLDISTGSTTVEIYQLEDENIAETIALTNFTGATNGNFDVGSAASLTPIEIRFGPGKTQKAHRFMVPEGATSGVAVNNYTYQDYVNVPFEVWDTKNNRQLMVSFRDQGREGTFNLIPANTTSAVATEQSREYLYIQNIDYNAATPSSSVTVNGGQEVQMMYNFWPTLVVGAAWPPVNNGILRVAATSVQKLNATTTNITDGREEFGNGKNANVHVDHHNIVMIPMSGSTYKILNANDGGVFVSNTAANPGVNNGNWTSTDNGYNTSQFYGADKRTGATEYFGGMQDNGTWKSKPAENASASSDYVFNIGGDGFEVIWHNTNTSLLIGGSQGNRFERSTNGGLNFSSATNGLSGDMPFITKLANSRDLPDRIFTLGGSGVFVSQNFGQNWALTPITEKWVNSSFMDIEVSRANADIVWAGAGMTANLNLHVSVDGGKTFSITNNHTEVTMGGITKLASHPTESNTAYALFSIAGKPKVLKTENLGESWVDISGFGTSNTSSTGFPDVAVYCLYVRPDNTDLIWAGTEIGIVESQDGGATWALLEDFINVSVWDMKGVDNEIVIATHGRGIWTATVDAPQWAPALVPTLAAIGTAADEKLSVLVTSESSYDSIRFFAGTQFLGSAKSIPVGSTVAKVNGGAFGLKTISAVAYKGSIPYATNSINGSHIDLRPAANSYLDYFGSTTNLRSTGFQSTTFENGTRRMLHTTHPYSSNANLTALVLIPITVASSNAILSYRDVAIVEPANDYVVVEASTDGINWQPLEDTYSASYNASWLATYNSNGNGTATQFVTHAIDLLDSFNAGEKILVRFRLSSNGSVQAWGWAIDYLAIQEQPTGAENLIRQTSLSAFPNPSRGSTTLSYEVRWPGDVEIELVNVLGAKVWKMEKKNVSAGMQTETISTTSFQPGTYIAVVRKADGDETIRLMIN
jgi:photosystem II stability/assembly factor-like uncharacterized protein